LSIYSLLDLPKGPGEVILFTLVLWWRRLSCNGVSSKNALSWENYGDGHRRWQGDLLVIQ